MDLYMSTFDKFNVKFEKQITIRNELVPIGETLENLIHNNVLATDEKRAENYQKAKVIIDNYHREFIDKALSYSSISWNKLAELLNKKSDGTEDLEKEQESLREKIVQLFKGCKEIKFKELFGKELIVKILPEHIKDNKEDLEVIKSFNKFTTYFSGFNDNRANIYTEKAQSTAIAYRIVHENFPKFLTAVNIYNVWKKECPNTLQDAQRALLDNKLLENETLDQVFNINYFNKLLSQQGIDKFNSIVGGVSAKVGDTKIQGLNEFINLATQKDTKLQDTLKKKKCAKLPLLFKQILSDRDNKVFLEVLNSDEEAIGLVKDFLTKEILGSNAFNNILKLFSDLDSFDLSHIYIQGKYINSLSKDLFGGSEWGLIKDAIERENSENKEFLKLIKKANNDVDKVISKRFYSIAQLNVACQKIDCNIDLTSKIKDSLSKLAKDLVIANDGNWPSKLKNATDKQRIKRPLDSFMALYKFIQVFSSAIVDKDLNFYIPFEDALEKFGPITALYNKVRNYATKKPYSLEKIKLNYDNPQLASGWSESKEQDYFTTIFIKDGKYYLGILNKKQKLDFSQGVTNSAEHAYKKLRYNLFKDISKMLPKCTTATKGAKAHFESSDDDYILKKDYKEPLVISKEIFDLANVKEGEIKKFQKAYREVNATEYRKALTTWIRFAIDFLQKYESTSIYDISKLKAPEQYDELTEFYADVDSITYKIDFCYVNEDFINNAIKKGSLYLFQINNKDFAKGATGTKNLHTMYFEAVFNDENLKKGVVKLNGGAELFYRKKSLLLEDTTTHNKGSVLVNKVIDHKDGTTEQIPEDIYAGIYCLLNKKEVPADISAKVEQFYQEHKDEIETKTATHDIIKDRRFTLDKFFFHCPISINFKAPSKSIGFNEKVLDFLKNNPDINIIGIDRGERNLLYVTVINQKGEIIDSVSFNEISKERHDNKTVKVNYHDKLELREKMRTEQKRSWDTVSKIATLKEGYLSSVIHELAKLMIKHNAIIVLENLNAGFKRIRNGIAERAVYQKFEKMLIDKLNYLVFKNNQITEPGGLINGYQLTNKLTTFAEIGQQTGFLFYVPAAYTSKIDPTTGFANVLNLNKAKNSKERKLFFSSFESIKYLPKEDLFKFTLDFSKSSLRCQAVLDKSKWDIYSYGKRIVRWKDKLGHFTEDKDYCPTLKLKNLFDEFQIQYQQGDELLDKLIKNESLNEKFWNRFFDIFKNILQMRNSVTGSTDPKDDYLISPVKNANGSFFDSRDNVNGLPKDADANGAYHIALKGLMILQKNNLAKNDKDRKSIKTISNQDWFKFAQKDRFAL